VPVYEHKCNECGHVWEDLFDSWRSPVPEECPECKVKGKIERLLSWCSGTVELSGRELIQKLKGDGQKMAQESETNENLAANLVGEDKYHKNKTS
jgi:putative FmdB family regulatory protein